MIPITPVQIITIHKIITQIKVKTSFCETEIKLKNPASFTLEAITLSKFS